MSARHIPIPCVVVWLECMYVADTIDDIIDSQYDVAVV